MSNCIRCGNIKFHSHQAYKDHMKLFHDLTISITLKAHNFTGRAKSEIVEEKETFIRNAAWFKGKLNPLIGCSKDSIEPTWNEAQELL